jgi:hypothetical protein
MRALHGGSFNFAGDDRYPMLSKPRPEYGGMVLGETFGNFAFAIACRVLSLRDIGPGIERYYERIEPLVRSPKLGPVLWQLPPNFKRDDERLAAALIEVKARWWAASSPTRSLYTRSRVAPLATPNPAAPSHATVHFQSARFLRRRRGIERN